jgi:hypothetical protein
MGFCGSLHCHSICNGVLKPQYKENGLHLIGQAFMIHPGGEHLGFRVLSFCSLQFLILMGEAGETIHTSTSTILIFFPLMFSYGFQ